MKKNTDILETESFYHIYNRGINGEDVFKSDSNYLLFLKKYSQHIEPIANTYAYCLLKNHFHFLVRIRSAEEIKSHFLAIYPEKEINAVEHFISNQFAHLFNGYTQSINNAFNRTGGLFETPFRRIKVDNKGYFSQLIAYIHQNPQKHGMVNDFENYPYSSYQSHLAQKSTRLQRGQVLDWFGGINEFEKFHKQYKDDQETNNWVIEFDP